MERCQFCKKTVELKLVERFERGDVLECPECGAGSFYESPTQIMKRLKLEKIK